MKSIRKEYPDRLIWTNTKGQLHRVDGPAVECTNGTKVWYLNGKRHRVDGPAVERTNGYKAWFIKGKRHREDGPALEFANRDKEWYLNEKCYSEQEYNEELLNIRLQRLMEL